MFHPLYRLLFNVIIRRWKNNTRQKSVNVGWPKRNLILSLRKGSKESRYQRKSSFLQGGSEGRIRINPSSDLLGTTLQAGHEYWSAPFSPYIVLLSRAASFHQDSPFSSFPPSHPGPPCFLLLLTRPPVPWPGKQRTLFTIDFILTWSSYARHGPLC